MKNKKMARKIVRKLRIKSKLKLNSAVSRIAVYRSNKNIYAQLVDDVKGETIACVNSKDLKDKKLPKSKLSYELGRILAEKAKKLKIEKAVFDRGGFQYHGRVKSLAEGAREGGLKF